MNTGILDSINHSLKKNGSVIRIANWYWNDRRKNHRRIKVPILSHIHNANDQILIINTLIDTGNFEKSFSISIEQRVIGVYPNILGWFLIIRMPL